MATWRPAQDIVQHREGAVLASGSIVDVRSSAGDPFQARVVEPLGFGGSLESGVAPIGGSTRLFPAGTPPLDRYRRFD